MDPNPLLKKLGFSARDRLAVIHADDIGMSQATLPAVRELFAAGSISSAAVMVPCPWFRGAAAFARDHPQADLGVHLTLNSEWEPYRWGPVSTRRPGSGLLDEQGFFHDNTAATQAEADLAAVRAELDAQFAMAAAAGIRATHADTHMFCLGHERLVRIYVEATLAAGTLPVMMRRGSPGWLQFGFPQDGFLWDYAGALEERGLPMLDGVYMMNLDTPQERLAEAISALDSLPPGITHFILHPAIDSPELRAMAPDWACRVADYETFKSPALAAHLKEAGIQVVGYELLKGALEAQGSLA